MTPVQLLDSFVGSLVVARRRKVKAGVRMMKTGPAKHKFDLEAHEARKNGGLYK